MENITNNSMTANKNVATVETTNSHPVTQKESSNRTKFAQRRHEIPLVWKVLGKARPIFEVQIKKSNEVKLNCIQRFMPAIYADEARFWMDFMEQVNILLDSRRFCRDCKALGYEPENVAEHVVFLGSTPMRKVLKDGLKNTLGSFIRFYGERFSPESTDSYRDQTNGSLEMSKENNETAA